MKNTKKRELDMFKDYVYLQIGCGKSHIDNYINLDISNACNPDLQCDIRKGLPFEDNKFEEVLANGILEMIHPNEEFMFVLNEIWRVLKSDGHLVGQVPSIDQRVLGLDPFDKRWFKEETFDYWNVDKNPYKQFGTQYGFKPWKVEKAKTNDNGIICFDMQPAK